MSSPHPPFLHIAPDLNDPAAFSKPTDAWRLFHWLVWFPQALYGWIRLHPAALQTASLPLLFGLLTICLALLVGSGFWLWLSFSFASQLTVVEQVTLPCIAVFASVLVAAGLLILGMAIQRPSVLVAAFAASPMLVTFFLLFLLQYKVAVISLLDLALAQGVLGSCAGFFYSSVSAYQNRGLPYIRLVAWLGAAFCACLLLGQFSGIVGAQPTPANVQSTALRILTAAGICYVGFLGAALRIEDWIGSALRLGWIGKQTPLNHVGKVTFLPMPGLSAALTRWVNEDWDQALAAAADLWNYTRQRRVVVEVFYRVMLDKAKTPCFSMQIKALIAMSSDSWQPQYFLDGGKRSSKQLLQQLPQQFVQQLLPSVGVRALLTYSDVNGFNARLASEEYCKEELFKEANEQLMKTVGLTSEGADALTQLTRAIDRFLAIRQPLAVADLPEMNAGEMSRQTGIWPALNQLMEILLFCWLAQRCQNSQTQGTALQTARKLLDEFDVWITRPELSVCENKVLSRIAANWRQDLESGRPLEIVQFRGCPQMPAEPFVYNEPLWQPELMRDCEKARETLVKALNSKHLQVCEISGPVLCGKTSLLKTTTASSVLIGPNELIIVDLKFLNTQAPALKRVALTLFDRLSARHRNPFWTEEKLLSDPLRVLEQLIHEICLADEAKKLIIALDSIENIDNVLTLHHDLNRFLHFLFHLCESIPNLGIVLICTPDHGHNYESFRSSITRLANPSTLSFFDSTNNSVIAKFLQQPQHGFCHRFTQTAVERVAFLTGGQPYLVQLLAAGVLKQFGDHYHYFGGAVPAGQTRFYDPLFIEEDVNEASGAPFVMQGLRYYWHRLEQHFASAWPDIHFVLRHYRSDWNAPLQPAAVAAQYPPSPTPVNTSYVADLMDRLVKQGILDSDNAGQYTLRVKILHSLL